MCLLIVSAVIIVIVIVIIDVVIIIKNDRDSVTRIGVVAVLIIHDVTVDVNDLK